MKLKKIRISYMDHPQVLTFYHEILNYLGTLNTIPFDMILEKMKESVDLLETSFNIYHRNVLVRQISLEERNLQHNLLSLKFRLKKNLGSDDAKVINLSEKALIVQEYFHTSKHVSVHQKDDKIFNLVDALEDFLTERERTSIGIATYVRNLKKVNSKLRVLMEERDRIQVTSTKHNLLGDRHAADNAYREFVNYMNLQIKTYPEDPELITIISRLNELIMKQWEKINTMLKQNPELITKSIQNIGVA